MYVYPHVCSSWDMHLFIIIIVYTIEAIGKLIAQALFTTYLTM